MKIQNYGDWKGDKRGGHHPPACTCYRCNEERRRIEASKEEERRVAEYDRQVEKGRRSAQPNQGNSVTAKLNRPGGGQTKRRTNSQRQATKAVQQSVADSRSKAYSSTGSRRSNPPRREGKGYRISRPITASTLRYALALHAAAIVGVVVYALVRGGGANVMPTLSDAAEAYVQAWNSMGNFVGLG